MTTLFSPLRLRGIELKNRIAVSPMCQYSSEDGLVNDWHLVHLGSRAVGGAGLVLMEAAAVSAEGRITPGDVGIWNDEQVPGLARITQFVQQQGAVAGIQLAHAGRKASHTAPWEGGRFLNETEGGWSTVAPSALPFSPDEMAPQALDAAGIAQVVNDFRAATQRALTAGFEVVEIHAAHGYLLHEFMSPLSNQRTDAYGGSFENRTRLLREVTTAVRETWPAELPLLVRISATDWTEGGWTADDSVRLAADLTALGVDLLDCSTGGNVPKADIPVGPSYQVEFAARVRQETSLPTGAVGLITNPQQADAIIQKGEADLILLARELLRDPYWPLHTAHALGHDVDWPVQYERAKPRPAKADK